MKNGITLSDIAAVTEESNGKGMNARIKVTFNGNDTLYTVVNVYMSDSNEIVIEAVPGFGQIAYVDSPALLRSSKRH